jgi:hypothetical protein
MKYSLINNWRRHVKGTKCSHVRHETTCRFTVEVYCLSLGTPGQKYSLAHLAIDLIQYDASHDIHPNFAKSPNSPTSFRLLTSLLGSKPS